MQNEQYVISLIRAVLGIQPYPITSPSDAALPFVIWNFVAGEEEFDLSGPSGFREETYTFTIVARTYDEVVDIREDLRTLLQNSSPLTFVNTGESPTFDNAEYPNLYVQNVLYTGLLPTTTIVSPQVLSASYAQTCSFLTGTIESASFAVKSKTAETASYMAGAIESASYAATASYVKLPTGLMSASAQVDYNDIQNKPEAVVTASYAVSASYAPTNAGVISSSAQFDNGDDFSIRDLTVSRSLEAKELHAKEIFTDLLQPDTISMWVGDSTVHTQKIKIDVGSLVMRNGNIVVTGSIKVRGSLTGSLQGTSSYALQAKTASYALNTPTLPDGLVSSSAQVLADTGIYSSSAQLPAGLVSASAQVFQNSDVYSSSLQLPAGILSSSAQLPDGIISSSAQLPDGVVSSSAQVLEGSNVYSSSAQLPSGIVSGSTQIADWSVLSSSYALTSSHAVSASWAPAQPAVSASYAATASTWNGYSVWVGTAVQYAALGGTYDAATLYFVK